MFDAFWRAAAYCLHPKVIAWSLLPLLLTAALALGAGWLWWEAAVAAVRSTLEQWALVELLLGWLQAVGGSGLRALIAPMIVLALALPLVVIVVLLLVAWLMAPALIDLVARRRFTALQRQGAASAWWQGVAWSLGCALLALVMLLLTLPLWLVPPLALALPALIWGWLTAKVLGFDAVARHASADERRLVMHAERWPLLAMGIACGLLGAAPSLLWALGAVTLVFAPLLVVVAVWLYTLVFAFATLWFAHFGLARLERLRATVSLSQRPAPSTGEEIEMNAPWIEGKSP